MGLFPAQRKRIAMRTTLGLLLLAYLSGSVLFANVMGDLCGKREMYRLSPDQNPGVANAYKFGGFWCGTAALVGDLGKGFLPVYFFLRVPDFQQWAVPMLIAAPVIGHILPVFYRFHGGKGIAVTFGCLLGLFPYLKPVIALALFFILFSTGLKISPHFFRTIAAYLFSMAAMVLTGVAPAVCFAFLIITGAVCVRMHMSKEERGKMEVKPLWMR